MLFLASVVLAAPLNGFVSGGVGFPEMAHLEGGVFVAPRVDVGARVGWVLFNPEVGVLVHGFLLGTATDRPPRHSLLVSGALMVNPTPPFSLRSGGERLGGYLGVYGGYAYTGEAGFIVRAELGALLYAETGFAMGPNAVLSVGWAF